MIILLSPAKSLDFEPLNGIPRSQPRFKKDTLELVDIMKKKKEEDLKSMMKISDKLASLNVARFKMFESSHTRANSKQAVFAFRGDVYQGLNADDFSKKELDFAQKHVRLLSGLYGLLRPLDVIQPYRLEMGTKLKTKRGNTLYEFWGDSITGKINEDLKASGKKAVINLASVEYFSSVDRGAIRGDIYDIRFKEWRGGVYKIVSFNAKKARGYMTRYIVKNGVTNPEKIKGFDLEGYSFNHELSSDRDWTFTRG